MSHSSLNLQPSRPRGADAVYQVFQTLSGMLGIFLERPSPLRRIVSTSVILSYGALLVIGPRIDAALAMALFGSALLVRYGVLFWSFREGGIASKLIGRFGRENGFAVYEALSALLLAAQRLAFIALLLASTREVSTWGATWSSCGAVLIVLGASMSVWATHVAGVDTYYYRDLFMGPRHVSLEQNGPYSFFSNPMYGVGQLAAYGVAMMFGSLEGMVAAALNQAASYAFAGFVERPHLRAATRLSVDTEVQEALARSEMVLSSAPPALEGFGRPRRPPPRKMRARTV
jgi:protein-S-isoprenylcysteine O-methyltransferase Ste14